MFQERVERGRRPGPLAREGRLFLDKLFTGPLVPNYTTADGGSD